MLFWRNQGYHKHLWNLGCCYKHFWRNQGYYKDRDHGSKSTQNKYLSVVVGY
jgi:hypothetical protein